MFNMLTSEIDKKYRALQNDPQKALVESIKPFELINTDKKLDFVLTILYATIESLTDSQKQVFAGELRKAGIEV